MIFLDLVTLSETLLEQLGHTGSLQIASFHPDYCFANVEFDDQANYSNRSPYPAMHLLLEDSVEQALQIHPDPAAIPLRNIKHLRAMEASHIRTLGQLKNSRS